MTETQDKAVSNKLVNSLKKWLALDDEVLKLKTHIKELTTEQKEYETIILEEMDKLDEKIIAVSDGKIKKNVVKSKSALKKEYIQKTILDFTKDEGKTKELLENMEKKINITEKIKLTRIKNKDSLIKKNDEKL
jgi:hypothetical protein